MPLPQKILMATDFSDQGDDAGDAAIALAELVGASIEWTHAVDAAIEFTPLYGDAPAHSPVDQARRMAVMKLEALEERARQRGVATSQQELEGSPAAAVAARAAELGADLVVVGSHGHTGLRRALIGSVAERIVREAPCSVLVVRGDTTPLAGDTLVLAEDLTPCAAKARALAYALAERGGFSLHAVHALDVGIPYLATLEVMVPQELTNQLYADARRELDALAEPPGGVKLESEITSERPSAAICEAARRTKASLVVMGAHGRRGLERLLLGSTAENVVRHAPCSVWVAR